MIRQISKQLYRSGSKRLITTSAIQLHRVAIIGGAGGIGQALAMLMKTDPLVTDLVLMDIQNTAGIAADVSHIDTFSGVKSVTGVEKMSEALECANLVVVAAGVPRSPTMTTRSALFEANAEIIHHVALAKAKQCPNAFMAIITNPINSLIPLAAEILKQNDVYDPRKLFGISKVDTMRARTFIGDHLVIDPTKVQVNVVGGHSNNTIVPIISNATPHVKGEEEELLKIYDRIRNGGSLVYKAKEGKGATQLSMAYIAMAFCNSLLKAVEGKSGVNDVAFVESKVHPDVPYFSSNFDLNKDGVKKFGPLPEMNKYEKSLLERAIPELKENIELGINYAKSKKGKEEKLIKEMEKGC